MRVLKWFIVVSLIGMSLATAAPAMASGCTATAYKPTRQDNGLQAHSSITCSGTHTIEEKTMVMYYVSGTWFCLDDCAAVVGKTRTITFDTVYFDPNYVFTCWTGHDAHSVIKWYLDGNHNATLMSVSTGSVDCSPP